MNLVRHKDSEIPPIAPERLAELEALADAPDSEIDLSEMHYDGLKKWINGDWKFRNMGIISPDKPYENVGLYLYLDSRVVLILEYPTGITYANQTGGLFCHQSEQEGCLALLGDWPEREKLEAVLAEYTLNRSSLNETEADHIDFIFKEYGPPNPNLKVDRDRDKLIDSEEAWLHVLVESDPYTWRPFDGKRNVKPESEDNWWLDSPIFKCKHGILTWENSD